jgi:hypothetical protein
MTCSTCGSTVPADTTGCPRCGAPLASRAATAAPAAGSGAGSAGLPASAPARAAAPAFRFDASRWTRADRITGGASLLLLVSLFLPWYGVSLLGISAEADGVTAHGYLYLVMIVCLAIVGYLGAVGGYGELPVALPLSHRQRLLAASGLNAAIVLLAFLVKPAATGWRFGAFVGLAAALAAVAVQARRSE